MNRFAPLLLATSLSLLAACHSGMSNRDYLHGNVASWNGTVSMVEQWTNGPNGESFRASLQNGTSMQQHRFGLKNAHKEVTDCIVFVEQFTHGEEANELHQNLRDSLQSTADMFAVMEQLAALPDGYGEEQVPAAGQAGYGGDEDGRRHAGAERCTGCLRQGTPHPPADHRLMHTAPVADAAGALAGCTRLNAQPHARSPAHCAWQRCSYSMHLPGPLLRAFPFSALLCRAANSDAPAQPPLISCMRRPA
ncbi:MAG: hypothetical protein GAK43_00362 [Stenotrophomonas maltophilia]|nr:MAG: hypothetical protein GAK43_00362 [Stenotrophomonas maltophilia]